MAIPQAIPLYDALQNIHEIKVKLAATNGALTKNVFSTSGAIQDIKLDTIRAAIGLVFTFLVQNLSAIKTTDPIAMAYPDIHHNLMDHTTRCNWLLNGYGTPAKIKWSEVADSIYDDVPTIENGIIAALKALGYENPSGG
ncbi:hypothetical protein JOM56_005109 [Amanita muscaria]